MKPEFSLQKIRNIAKEHGFSHIGFNKAEATDQAFQEYYKQWIKDKKQAKMFYLEKNIEKRFDPRKLHLGTNSIITMLYPYQKAKHKNSDLKIASYAQGFDYHIFLKKQARALLELISEADPKHEARFFTDSAPIADRYWAWKAGLGFIGKNGFLTNPKYGSRFFIAHIFTSLELYENNITLAQACGNCNLCLSKCPTQAIASESGLNSERCIAYHTIESKLPIPEKITQKNPSWIFGCDICQDVCPYNKKTFDFAKINELHSDWHMNPTEEEWLNINENDFKNKFKDTAIFRTGLKKIQGNVSSILYKPGKLKP